MKRNFLMLLIVLLIILVVLLIRTTTFSITQNNNTYKTQENLEGAVTVEVTPISLSSKEDVKFTVSLNTHSVELNKNLKETSILIDDQGKEYKPISWYGGKDGHHINGSLVFSPLSKDIKEVKLIIKGIADKDRTFTWNL